MPDLLMRVIPAMLGTTLAVSASAAPSSHDLGPHDLMNVSEALLRAYNAKDAPAFHQLLAPSLQSKHPVEEIVLLLARCRGLTHEIDRFSIPSWGTRSYGFFGVYAETAVLEMILEIDEDARIVHWVVTDDVAATNQQCVVSTRE